MTENFEENQEALEVAEVAEPVEAEVDVETEAQDVEAEDALDPGEKAVQDFSKSLRGLEGKWYVLHTYSGYEKRVKMNVESRVQ